MTYKVKLEVFEGPLDLLLYLIKKEEIDIYDIPIAKITDQYLGYLEMMKLLDLNIAGEFIVMAATLMHIKSRMLLPQEGLTEEELEEDPRAELVRRLLEYKKFKEAAGDLSHMARKQKDYFVRLGSDKTLAPEQEDAFIEANLFDLITAFSKILKEIPKEVFQEVVKDEFTVSQKIHDIVHMLVDKKVLYFTELFKKAKNKAEIISTFLAVLELIRLKEIMVRQKVHFGEIEILRDVKSMEPVKGGE
jgi:segregation and condensation protein A